MALQRVFLLFVLTTKIFAQYTADCDCEKPDDPSIFNSCTVDNSPNKTSGRRLECECKDCPLTVKAACQCSSHNWQYGRFDRCDVCYACTNAAPENTIFAEQTYNSGYVNEIRSATCILNCRPVQLVCNIGGTNLGGVWSYHYDICPGFLPFWSATWNYTIGNDPMTFHVHHGTKQVSFSCPQNRNLVPFNPKPVTCDNGVINGQIPSCQMRSASCNGHQVSCDIGRCISSTQVCDGVKDCADGSDERRCGYVYKTSSDWDVDVSSDFTPTEASMYGTEASVPRAEYNNFILVIILAVLLSVATLALIICGVWNWHLRRKLISITPVNTSESIPMNPAYLELVDHMTTGTNERVEDNGYLEPITRDLSGTMHVEIPVCAGDPGSPYADVLNLENNQVVAEYDYILHNGRKL